MAIRLVERVNKVEMGVLERGGWVAWLRRERFKVVENRVVVFMLGLGGINAKMLCSLRVWMEDRR